MIRTTLALAIPLGVIALTTVGRAAPPEPTSARGSVELGVRVGYGFPFGHFGRLNDSTTDTPLRDVVRGQVPVWFDAGYRTARRLYVGLFVQYGVGLIDESHSACGVAGVTCTVGDFRLGGIFMYDLSSDRLLNPWLGVGLGYEWLTQSAHSADHQPVSATASGPQASVHAGAEFRVGRQAGIGPFLSCSVGQYRRFDGVSPIEDASFHEWVLAGVRGTLDLGL